MSQVVIFNFGKGSCESGFAAVTVQLWDAGSSVPTQYTGSLPAFPQLPALYERWQMLYEALHSRTGWRRTRSTIEIEACVTNVSEATFTDLCQQLKSQIDNWLDSGSLGKVERRLRTKLGSSTEIRMIFETDDALLRRLPWHLWSFFEDYPQAEIALCTQTYGQVKAAQRASTGRVRVLAILGNSEGIDVQKDRKLLEQLPKADTVFLVEPDRQELDRWLWDEQGWDILFFAGHSISHTDGATGEIGINRTDSLTVAQLKNALRAAIDRGLKLAIFNSCDGLGLAHALADLNIPQIVVMREPVPDQVAQAFLKYLLSAYANNKSFYRAVREAREKLQGLENEFPCASWLPVICQNPAETPPTWQELYREPVNEVTVVPAKRKLFGVFLVSIAVLAIVSGVRQLGLLQTSELKAYDQLMRSRPNTEAPDSRLLIITVTAEDVQNQTDRRGSLSNRSLEQLLQKLDQYEPALVGLDIYRDLPIEAQNKNLINRLRQDDRLIAICKVGEPGNGDPGVSPPSDIPLDRLRKRVGFSDVTPDEPTGTIRRQLLGQAPSEDSACQTDVSFSLLLASRYLKARDGNIGVKWNPADVQIGGVTFKALEENTAGYRHLDASGYQVLLNYRASNAIAQQMTLGEALNGDRLTPDLVNGRIVLIGTVDPSFGDLLFTPYNQNISQQMPGVVVQAHMVSQILSAVLNGRSLIWWLPTWGEMIWIWVWSFAGGVIVWRLQSWTKIGLAAVVAITLLHGGCFVLLLQGGWIPLVPSALALVGGGGAVALYPKFQTRKQ